MMKVFNFDQGNMNVIQAALENRLTEDLQTASVLADGEDKDCVLDSIQTTRETLTKIKDQSLQELAERCMSYFWDRLSNEGSTTRTSSGWPRRWVLTMRTNC